MDQEHEAALRRELASLVNSPDRPAKDRRIREVREQLGEADEPGSGEEFEDAVDSAPRETAVRGRKGGS